MKIIVFFISSREDVEHYFSNIYNLYEVQMEMVKIRYNKWASKVLILNKSEKESRHYI